MRLAGLLYLLGALLALACGPAPASLFAALGVALSCLCVPRLRVCVALCAGFAWTMVAIDRAERELLAADLEEVTVAIGARVAAFPLPGAGGVALDFDDARARGAHAVPRRLRIAWPEDLRAPGLGDWCELRVRLRRPHGHANPGAPDSERAALVQHIGATGRVVAHPANHCAPIASARQVDGLRASLARAIEAAIVDRTDAAVLRALAVDDRGGLSEAQWDTMRRTGTAHLIAISGLQITLAAGACFGMCRALFGLAWAWRQDYVALRAAWFAASGAALLYSLVAGAGVPSVRAAVMVVCAATAALCGRRVLGLDTLLASLVALVAWDPLCLLGSGLWLSFGAVAVLVMLAARDPRGGAVALAWRTHLVMAFALAPVTLFLFGEVSWCAPLANFVAVPWCNVFVVPLVLVGMLCAPWAPAPAAILWDMAARLWHPLAGLLELLALAPPLALPQACGLLGVLAASAGIALLLAPRAVPGRALGLALLLAPLLPRAPSLAPGEFRVVQLDVGQGLALLVQTAHHAILYDSGPRWWRAGDAGARIVVPALRALGVRRLDALVISHGDLDHAGGAASVLAGMAVTAVLAGERPPGVAGRAIVACGAPLAWRLDGVDFEFLHPAMGAVPSGAGRNDRSCVLAVRGRGGRALLTGDIEQGVEAALLARDAARLAADVLAVAHHGSATSSSAAFVAAVRPRIALISAGWHNRYGLPRAAVVARYRALGAQVLNSATRGAVSVDLRRAGLVVHALRDEHWGWWRRRTP